MNRSAFATVLFFSLKNSQSASAFWGVEFVLLRRQNKNVNIAEFEIIDGLFGNPF